MVQMNVIWIRWMKLSFTHVENTKIIACHNVIKSNMIMICQLVLKQNNATRQGAAHTRKPKAKMV